VLPIFIFDTEILEKLENKNDHQVDYFWRAFQIVVGRKAINGQKGSRVSNEKIKDGGFKKKITTI